LVDPIVINLFQLQAFVETCRQGSYTRAAARLFLSQPALHHRVKELEAELQTPLLVVQNRRVVPTAKGQLVLEVGERVLQELRELEERVKDVGEQQSVRIGVATLIMARILSESIAEFRARRPDASVLVISLDVDELYDALIGNRVDAVVTFPNYVAPDLMVQPLMQVEYLWMGASAHPLADGQIHEPSELLAYPLALTERGMGQRTRVTEWFNATTGVAEVPVSFEARNASLLAQVAASSPLFITLLPETAREQFRLAPIRVRGHALSVEAVLCSLPTRQHRPVVDEFLTIFRSAGMRASATAVEAF
jgi:DNA-binding transcriptional LysR family regulator